MSTEASMVTVAQNGRWDYNFCDMDGLVWYQTATVEARTLSLPDPLTWLT